MLKAIADKKKEGSLPASAPSTTSSAPADSSGPKEAWGATPSRKSSRWDQPTPAQKKNRWDETPVAEQNANAWGATPKAVTEEMTPGGTKKKSRWDAAPGATPVSSMGMATPVGAYGIRIVNPYPCCLLSFFVRSDTYWINGS